MAQPQAQPQETQDESADDRNLDSNSNSAAQPQQDENVPPRIDIQPRKRRRKRRSKGWGNHTKSKDVYHAQAAQAKREDTITELNASIQDIKAMSQELRTPGMDWDDYRQLRNNDAVELFYTLRLQDFSNASRLTSKGTAYSVVPAKFDLTERTLRAYITEYESHCFISRSLQGKHAKNGCTGSTLSI